METNQAHFIDVAQLRVGLYVHLDLGWMDHPFTLSNFKLKDEDQINTIRKIGLKKLRYDPNRSDCDPLPTSASSPVTSKANTDLATEPASNESAEEKALAEKKRQQAERLKVLHRAMDENEKKFLDTTNQVKLVLKNFTAEPKQALAQATDIVNEIVDCAFTESEIAIHAINGSRSSDQNYMHPINVTVLSLMMARSLDMSEKEARMLGLAALLHDIGKAEIPDKILLKTEPLTKAEEAYFEQHSEIGARLAKNAGVHKRIAEVILQHHELADGSGYPKGLLNDQTDPLARLLVLINGFDNLCNPKHPGHALTPYAALAHMFANQRTKYDESLLRRMIKCLGVYPPGSIVQLSNGMHAIVVSVNPNNPLRPFVLLHDPTQDREEPQLLDLRDDLALNIVTCLRPIQLPPDALAYLSPRRRISYFLNKDFLEKK